MTSLINVLHIGSTFKYDLYVFGAFVIRSLPIRLRVYIYV